MLVLLDSLKDTQLIAGHPFSPLINKLQPEFQQFAEEVNCNNVNIACLHAKSRSGWMMLNCVSGLMHEISL